MDLASQAGPSQTRLLMDASSAASNAQVMIQAEVDMAGIQKFLKAKTPNIETLNAVGIAGGGSGAAFSQKEYKQFFTTKENRTRPNILMPRSTCYGLGHDEAQTGMTGAPWRVRSIDEMAEHEALFKDNKYTEIVHVNVGEDPLKVDVTKGGLSRTSPPELHFAYLKRLHKLLRLAGEANPEVCESIQAGILDVTARFYALTDDEAWWHEYNLRDLIEHLRKKVGQTVFQRICGLSAMKCMREENGAAAAGEIASLSEYMQSKAEYVSTEDEKDDAVSEFFVNTGFKLSETMQECPSVYHCLNVLDQERGFNNPLNSIHKISLCLKADSRPEALTWLFEWMRLARGKSS